MKQYTAASSSSMDEIVDSLPLTNESQKMKEGIPYEVIEIESDEDSAYLPNANEKGKNVMTNPTKGLPYEVIEIESDEDSIANEKGKKVMTDVCDGHSNDSTQILEPLKGFVMAEQDDDVVETIKQYKKFKNFDIVKDCLDHHFNGIDSSWVRQQPEAWARRIHKEWKILEKNLPDTIYVRAYEERMDLLRAAMVGAQGTPYHDGLFFFDILFPPNYPDYPPVLYYHSHGLTVNPNLYEDGFVCISLLSTWHTEKENEQWQPNLSNMLQVLVSIQGLVLNAQPYFNEPEFEEDSLTAEGQTTSFLFTEETFIQCVHLMMYTMRSPPKHFEDLVAGHFMTHAADILETCKAYIHGSRVVGLREGEAWQCHTQEFKNNLLSYLPVLVMEFANLGLNGIEKLVPASTFDFVVPPPPPADQDNEAEKNADEFGSEDDDDVDD